MEPTKKDYAVRQLSRMVLTLRDDLTFAPQQAAGDTYYVIEDPVQSKFHRIGLAEYTFISLLDGSRSVSEALRMAAKISPSSAFSEQEAASICKWLVDSRLAHTKESLEGQTSSRKALEQGNPGWQKLNPVFARIPLVFPDRFFDSISRWFGWIHAPQAIVCWGFVLLYAAYCVLPQWERFASASEGILAPGNWIGIGLSYLILKLCHELSHGIACRRYGGSVREIGVMLILLMPIPYVDATSSWRFHSKWQRIQTAAAGMYIELFLASLAAIAWSVTETGFVNHICYNTVIVGSVLTLAINANPLMRFDGYYMLSDMVEIPNLYTAGQQYLNYWARRYVLGVSAVMPQWSRSRAWLIRLYGPCALAWRICVCIGMVVGASVLLHGAGVVLSCLAILLWMGLPFKRLARYLMTNDESQRGSLRRLGSITGSVCIAVLVITFVIPWPGRVSAPAVVEYEPLIVMRAGSAGLVTEVHVHSGQEVAEGQLLAVLENDQLVFELTELKLAIEQSKLRCRALKRNHEMAEYQAELENQKGLVKQFDEKQLQVDQLALRAKMSGTVIGRNLDSLVGKYTKEGAELLTIGNTEHKALQLSIAQEDMESFREYQNEPIDIHLNSVGWFSSRLEKLDPRADCHLSHSAFSGAIGGPLPVRPKTDDSEKSESDGEYELIAPRFSGTVPLDDEMSGKLYAGQLATVSIRPLNESIGEHIYHSMARWLRKRLKSQAALRP